MADQVLIDEQVLHYVFSALMAEWTNQDGNEVGPHVSATHIERITTEANNLTIGDDCYVKDGGTNFDIPRNAFIREQISRLTRPHLATEVASMAKLLVDACILGNEADIAKYTRKLTVLFYKEES